MKKSRLLTLLLALCLAMPVLPPLCHAQTVQSPYRGAAIADYESVYLYNVSTGMFLQNNRRDPAFWTTRAQLDTSGKDIAVTAIDGGYQLNAKFGANHSINDFNLYLDTSQPATPWSFTAVPDDGGRLLYTITSGDYALGAATATGTDGRALITNTPSALALGGGLWQIVTADERLRVMAQATADSPYDASWLIAGYDFAAADERNAAWQGISGDHAIIADNKVSCNRLLERWNISNADTYQELSVPNGIYELWADACYSPTGASELSLAHLNAYNDGSEPVRGFLYANGASTPVPSLYGSAQKAKVVGCMEKKVGDYWIPGGNGQVSAAFYHGYYRTEKVRVRVTDGRMRVGVRVDDGGGKAWILMDNFTLSYLGTEGTAFAGRVTATPANGAKVGFDDLKAITLTFDGAASVQADGSDGIDMLLTAADGTVLARADGSCARAEGNAIVLTPSFEADNYGGMATATITGRVSVDGQPFVIGTTDEPLTVAWSVTEAVRPYLPEHTAVPTEGSTTGRQQLARIALTFTDAADVSFDGAALAAIYAAAAALTPDGSSSGAQAGGTQHGEPLAVSDAFLGDWALSGSTVEMRFRDIPAVSGDVMVVITAGSVVVDGRSVDEMVLRYHIDGTEPLTAPLTVAGAADAEGCLTVSPQDASLAIVSCRQDAIMRVTDTAGQLAGIAMPTLLDEGCRLTVYALSPGSIAPGTYSLTLPEALLTLSDGPSDMPSARQSHTFTVGEGVTFRVVSPTGISTPTIGQSSVIYDISGRRLHAPSRGINIIDGRKYITPHK